MSDLTILHQHDAEVKRLISTRDSISVLKYQLAILRSHNPEAPVLAFEGVDDKTIYYSWIKQIKPDFKYEPFPCSGKKQVFEFRAALDRDMGDLRKGVYYFVDRDFDDMADTQNAKTRL